MTPVRLGLVGGAIAGLVLSAAWIAVETTSAIDHPAMVSVEIAGPSVEDPEASAAFLHAWRRSLEGTFVSVASFERTMLSGGEPNGIQLSDERLVAQRPPDRLATGQGGLRGRLGEQRVGCTTGADDVVQCVFATAATSYDEETERQVAILDRYFNAAPPIYHVADEGNRELGTGPARCFQLTLAIGLPAPPYGKRAAFCFDAATGARVDITIERDEAIDRSRVFDLREPTGEEFELPADAVIERRAS